MQETKTETVAVLSAFAWYIWALTGTLSTAKVGLKTREGKAMKPRSLEVQKSHMTSRQSCSRQFSTVSARLFHPACEPKKETVWAPCLRQPSWQRAATDPDRKRKDGWESPHQPSCKFAAFRSSQVSERALLPTMTPDRAGDPYFGTATI